MGRASSDRFILFVEADDPMYNEDEVHAFMSGLHPLSVEAISTSEGY
jgi:hypothetical protein